MSMENQLRVSPSLVPLGWLLKQRCNHPFKCDPNVHDMEGNCDSRASESPAAWRTETHFPGRHQLQHCEREEGAEKGSKPELPGVPRKDLANSSLRPEKNSSANRWNVTKTSITSCPWD